MGTGVGAETWKALGALTQVAELARQLLKPQICSRPIFCPQEVLAACRACGSRAWSLVFLVGEFQALPWTVMPLWRL